MRHYAFTAIGLCFLLMGAGLYALTLRKAKPLPANPSKAQLREKAGLDDENRKMRVGAGLIAGVGAAVIVFGFL